MNACHGRSSDRVCSVFVSDVHLGCEHAQAESFLAFLNRYVPDRLYLVGDFIDGWKLKRRWRWEPVYHQIFRRLFELAKEGTQIHYIPGNHDAFMRHYLFDLGIVQVADEVVHESTSGHRFLVTHGDYFDRVEQEAQWISLGASIAYDVLLTLNSWINSLRGKSRKRFAFCGMIKQRVKGLIKHFCEFEQLLIAHAREKDCDGVICGHIHAPKISRSDDVIFCNTGDWVESCSALVEYEGGALEVVYLDGTRGDQLLPEPEDYPLLGSGASRPARLVPGEVVVAYSPEK